MKSNLLEQMLSAVTPEVYERFRHAVEVRCWPNGIKLTGDQMDICMQAIVAYEYRNVPEHKRTGYVPPKKQACESPPLDEPIKWQS